MVDKKGLRKEIRARKKAAEPSDMLRQSQEICERVLLHPRWQQATTVLLYHALSDEVDTSLLLQQTDKRILLPVVVGEELELREYDGRLKKGAFGIMEPKGESNALLVGGKDGGEALAIVPGMAFDTVGHRLGRGKGYYDRLFASLPSANVYKIGICYDFQLLEEVPAETHDIVMDEVISG